MFDYGYDIKDYGYIGASTLGRGPVDYTEKQIDKLMREEGILMEETKEGLTKEEKIAAVDYTEEQIDKLIREENVMETKELTKEELEKIAAEIRLAAGLDNPIKENTENTKGVKEMKVKEEIKENTENTKGVKEMKVKEEIKENRLKPVVNKVEKKGRKGIRVKGFNYNIATTTNSAIYDSFVAFHGTKKDAWLVWGRFNGTLEKDVNGQKEANFEFLLFENGKLIVTYWKAENYKIVAEKLAKAAIKRLLEANVR